VLLAILQHFCNNNIIILNYYYFIPGLFPSHSWWAESCSVRLSRRMVCSRQPRSFEGVHPHGRPDGWTEDGWRDGWRDARIQGRLHFSSRRPLLYRILVLYGRLKFSSSQGVCIIAHAIPISAGYGSMHWQI